ncbi:MAG TPA: DNA polymerase/3'-5' exonuclease PolX [Candidatus Magasanikbacteria bacterium]|nr:DNA polymerase/3'-5' exonuclease PolX [Candidatus Magasanikbacteria bacterium]
MRWRWRLLETVGQGGVNSMNQDIAKIFRKIAFILEAFGVPFKPRAHERAAEILESLGQDVAEIYQAGGLSALKEISGIGQALAEHIEEYIKTSHIKEFEELSKKFPVEIDELSRVEGLGPKKIRLLYKKLKVKNLADLEKATAQGQIAILPNFGLKSEENIKRGIAFIKKTTNRVPLGQTLPLIRKIIDDLKQVKGVKKIVTAGSARRWQETIGDIDLLATSIAPQKIMEAFVALPEVVSVYAQGQTKTLVRLKNGLDADLRVVAPEYFGSALQYFTGDKNHNVQLRELAIKKGYKLNEYGLFKAEKKIAGETEQEIYQKLGLKYPEPELRTASGELEAAKKDLLPNLIPFGSLKGDLQTTTNWTDGAASLKEMAEAAEKYGLKYIAITDHTQSLAMAHGLDERRLAQQGREIDKLNQVNKNFRIIKSAEVNINKDGTLDIKDEALAKLEIVSAAVHSSFRMSKEEMTKRILRAIEHPLLNILFHPTGRLINRREPYELDMDKIIKAAKANQVALELDCFPDRMDLKDIYVRQAVALGVKIAIDTDAHHPSHFQFLELGIGTARRAWVKKSDVINTWGVEKLLKWAKGKRY